MTCRKAAILLDRYATDELSAKERSLVEVHLNGCSECMRTLDGLRALRGVIASARTEHAPAVQKRTGSGRRSDTVRSRLASLRMPHYISAASVAAAAVIAVLVLPSRMNVHAPQWLSDTTRIKGTNAIFIYRKNGDSPVRLADGASARKGDIFQICYIATDRYGVLFSVDGRGGVTLHFPPTADGSTELIRNRETCLDRANELDDAPRYEKFFLASSAKAMDTAAVIALAKKTASRANGIDAISSALSNCTVVTFTLRK